MEGYIVYGLWLLFLATIVFGILKVLDFFVDDSPEECPLGNDCAIKTSEKKEASDGVEHTKEYYDTERNK